MRPAFFPLALLAALGGCGTEAPRPAPIAARPPPAPEQGLGRAMGQQAGTLVALFGAPALDVREGPARKLQFRGPACTLDAYLYPAPGGGAARVTWIDTRTPRGDAIDRASCVAALSRR